jgi:apolipoprotein N-acyltransferase
MAREGVFFTQFSSLRGGLFSGLLGAVLVSLLLGAVLTLAFHPFNQFYLVPISLACFLHIVDLQSDKKQQFIIGFSFGFGHFLTSLYWISYALFVEADKFAWLMPVAVLVIPFCLALFTGLLAILISPYMKVSRVTAALIFPTLWVIIEMLRSYLIFPFPWNLLGYASNFSLPLMQMASVAGVYGLSFFLALSGSALYSKNIRLISGCYLILAISCAWGYARINDGVLKAEIDNDVRSFNFRLIQPNITEQHFGDIDKQIKALDKLSELSFQPSNFAIDFLIWPESGFPFAINQSFLSKFQQILASNTTLLFGADRVEQKNDVLKVYNSLVSVNHAGDVDIYDKHTLVPFGEYQPFRNILPFLDKITYGMQDFDAGSGSDILKINRKEHIKPFICYEAIFPLRVFNEMSRKALFLLNITNDFWFGDSIGPYQHFAMARMRAIEYGMPLVRVANTGISAVIDAYGRVLQEIDLNLSGVIDISVKVLQVETVCISSFFNILMLLLILSGLLIGVANYVIHLYK